MLRNLITNTGKACVATYKAAAEMATGCAVVKDAAAGTVAFPSAATTAELFFVTKEKIPVGAAAGRADHSDYEEQFIKVAEGEHVVLVKFGPGEVFATDQVTGLDASAVGKTVAAGKDGKLAVATAASCYRYIGDVIDNGHTLAKIEVLDTAVAN